MKKTVSVYDFMDACKKFGRDYYSYEGYQALFEWYEEIDPDFELDVIAICCEWTEYTPEELENDYHYILDFVDWREEKRNNDETVPYTEEELKEEYNEYIKDLANELEQRTTVIELSDTFLVLVF